MRIALLTREFPPETSWGGIGTHYHAFARGLQDAGCDVEVFVQGVREWGTSMQDGVPVHRVIPRRWVVGPRSGGDLGGGSLSTIGLFSYSLARAFREALRRRHAERPFAVVDGHEHLGVGALIYRDPPRGLLCIVRYQTPYDSFVTRRMVNWPRSRVVRWLENAMITRAHARVATSHSVENFVREDFPRAPPAEEIIPNMTPILNTHPVAFEVKEPLMLFVGRLMPEHKNPELAAQAFAQLAGAHPSWRIEFAGNDIPLGDGRTAWNRCAKILAGHPGRSRYHGVLPPDRLEALYRRAKILIVPSRIESYGLVTLEGMSLGCVPVVSDGTALPEVVGDCGVVFANGDRDSLVAKLGTLLSDPQRLARLGERSFEEVQRRFAPESIVAANLAFFDRERARIARRSG